MKIRIKGIVQHNGHLLEQHEIYEISDYHALEMIKYDLAEAYTGDREGLDPGDPISRPKVEVDHYSAEATPSRPLKEDEIDTKPVIEPTHEPEPPIVTDDPEAKPEAPKEEVKVEAEVVTPAVEEEVVEVPVGPRNDETDTPPDDTGMSKEN